MFELIKEADEEPVSVAELKSQLRITSSAQDTMLNVLLKSARQWAEDFLRYQMISATWDKYFDDFPASGDCIWIQKSPVTSITYIKYLDSSGTLTEWANTYWTPDYNSTPCRIYEKYGYTYPTTQATKNAVVVRFEAGYTDADAVPDIYKQAILMKAASLYENPSDEVTGTQVNKMSLTSEKLLRPFRAIRY